MKWYFKTPIWVLEVLFAKLDIPSRTFQWKELRNIDSKTKTPHKFILYFLCKFNTIELLLNHSITVESLILHSENPGFLRAEGMTQLEHPSVTALSHITQ